MFIDDYENTPNDLYTNDEYPVLDPADLAEGPPRTEETEEENAKARKTQYNLELGIMGENETLEDSPIYDNEMALENLET